MKEKKLYDAITNINDKFIDEANNKPLKKHHTVLKRTIAIAACFAFVATGTFIFCRYNSNVTSASYRSDAEGIDYNVTYPKSISVENYDAMAANIKDNPVSDSAINAVNSFGYSSAAKIFKSGDNNNFSPISLYYSIATAASGSNGTTKEELLKVLGFSSTTELSNECGNLYRVLYFDNEIGKLKIANSLWIGNELNLSGNFSNNAAKNFYASSHKVNFNDSSTKLKIADWIKENTNGTITPQIKVDGDTLLSIINTVYLNDQWAVPFDKNDTKNNDFTLANGQKVQTSYLNGEFSGIFAAGENFSRAELKLENGGKMVFVLPDNGVSTSELLKDSNSIKNAFEGGKKADCKVKWQIPKFGFNSSYELIDALKSLGVTSAFSKDADFSGITGEKSLMISRIHQETYIKLNELGVEASAFTQTDMKETCALPPDEKAEMILNRPFIYGIYSNNGTLLFVGVCENPSGK